MTPPAPPSAAESPLTEPDVSPEAEVKDEAATDPNVSALFAKKKKKPVKK